MLQNAGSDQALKCLRLLTEGTIKDQVKVKITTQQPLKFNLTTLQQIV